MNASTAPTKKRGIVWLIGSLVLLCTAGFYWIILSLVHAFTSLTQGLSNLGRTAQIFFNGTSDIAVSKIAGPGLELFALAGVCALAYFGVCYGITLIVAAYKQSNFRQARIYAAALGFASLLVMVAVPKLLA